VDDPFSWETVVEDLTQGWFWTDRWRADEKAAQPADEKGN
jgi:hypothetical protein